MQTARLPDALQDAILEEAAGFSTGELAAAAAQISQAYRQGLPPRLDTAASRAAYRITRMPATYAALARAAAELPFTPESWLDLGAGPGAAAWVAPCPATLVDENPHWEDLRRARRICADLTRLPHLEPHDVASLAYVLNELPPAARPKLVDEAWRLARRAPGTSSSRQLAWAAARKSSARSWKSSATATATSLPPRPRFAATSRILWRTSRDRSSNCEWNNWIW